MPNTHTHTHTNGVAAGDTSTELCSLVGIDVATDRWKHGRRVFLVRLAEEDKQRSPCQRTTFTFSDKATGNCVNKATTTVGSVLPEK
jgi:hypothetical protein